jgi:hypothetical protein
MQRVDGSYLYKMGSQIHSLGEFRYQGSSSGPPTTMFEALLPLYLAEAAIDGLVNRSVFRLKTSVNPGQALLEAVRALKTKIDQEPDKSKPLEFTDVYPISSTLTAFETVLAAEFALLPLYVVMQQSAFDMTVLIESGARCFPIDVVFKVPEAVADLEQGTKCIAFALPTAAGFHLHRANESVLRKYWDSASKGAAQPGNRTMGEFIAEMEKTKVGDPKVRSALKDLKNLHRNPLIHPEHSLGSVDEAIALMNGIHSVMVHMLKEIPFTTAPLPAGAAAGPTGPAS